MIPADCVLIDSSASVACSEATLTGEQEDRIKSKDKDCFLLSSTLISECDSCRAMVFGIGLHSQYGKIKANLTVEHAETPLQAKLEEMTKQVSDWISDNDKVYLGYFPFFSPLNPGTLNSGLFY